MPARRPTSRLPSASRSPPINQLGDANQHSDRSTRLPANTFAAVLAPVALNAGVDRSNEGSSATSESSRMVLSRNVVLESSPFSISIAPLALHVLPSSVIRPDPDS